LDQLTIPLVGCEEHLGHFTSICGLTSEDTADLLDHPPAGGIRCPNCRLTPQTPHPTVIPVQTGAVAVLACPEHQVEMGTRFQTGLDTQHTLTTGLNTSV
jgi:hypothetical protein